ncbi:hypothetical protein [Chroococcidiopsis sp.]|uniref:hypothetical protein n=1 Tax=Chroococcidiopsis sp. TaxID=3088168 RepID=UPI003F3215D1
MSDGRRQVASRKSHGDKGDKGGKGAEEQRRDRKQFWFHWFHQPLATHYTPHPTPHTLSSLITVEVD